MQLGKIFKLIHLFVKYFTVDTEIVVAALIYTDRILARNVLHITEQSAVGFLHSALVLASKFFLDRFERHTLFHILINEDIGRDSRHRMRAMMDQYLDLIAFELNIAEDEYKDMMGRVKHMIAQKYGAKGQIVILESSIRRHSSKNLRQQYSGLLDP